MGSDMRVKYKISSAACGCLMDLVCPKCPCGPCKKTAYKIIDQDLIKKDKNKDEEA